MYRRDRDHVGTDRLSDRSRRCLEGMREVGVPGAHGSRSIRLVFDQALTLSSYRWCLRKKTYPSRNSFRPRPPTPAIQSEKLCASSGISAARCDTRGREISSRAFRLTVLELITVPDIAGGTGCLSQELFAHLELVHCLRASGFRQTAPLSSALCAPRAPL